MRAEEAGTLALRAQSAMVRGDIREAQRLRLEHYRAVLRWMACDAPGPEVSMHDFISNAEWALRIEELGIPDE